MVPWEQGGWMVGEREQYGGQHRINITLEFYHKQGGVFHWASLKVQSTEKLIEARLGVSTTIYVNVDSHNLGFPNLKKNTLYHMM